MTLEQIFTLGLVLVMLIAVGNIFSIVSMHSRMKFEKEMLELGYVQFRSSDEGPFVWVKQENLENYTACVAALLIDDDSEHSNGKND